MRRTVKLKKAEFLFILFSSCLAEHPQNGRGLAISFVKKSQLKNFSDMKTAGGCGVVRFWSFERFIMLRYDSSAKDVSLI